MQRVLTISPKTHERDTKRPDSKDERGGMVASMAFRMAAIVWGLKGNLALSRRYCLFAQNKGCRLCLFSRTMAFVQVPTAWAAITECETCCLDADGSPSNSAMSGNGGCVRKNWRSRSLGQNACAGFSQITRAPTVMALATSNKAASHLATVLTAHQSDCVRRAKPTSCRGGISLQANTNSCRRLRFWKTPLSMHRSSSRIPNSSCELSMPTAVLVNRAGLFPVCCAAGCILHTILHPRTNQEEEGTRKLIP